MGTPCIAMGEVFDNARTLADAEALNAQERNRLWWERLPMTYVDWESKDRISLDSADGLLRHNPFLRGFDFTAFKNSKVLDLGCGAGTAACLFAKGGAKVTAVDLTQNAVDLTRRNAADRDLRLSAVRADAENLGLQSDSFDYVFSWGALHHSSDTLAAFREVSRILKTDGRGLIMVYNKSSLRYYLKGFYWLLAKAKAREVGWSLSAVQRFYTDGYYHRHFTPGELKKGLTDTGLRVTKIFPSHMAKQMIPGLPKKLDEFLKRKWGWLLVAEVEKIS
jgi:ubiquinone/menaquinone biosynthesis C-methylase UbiE